MGNKILGLKPNYNSLSISKTAIGIGIIAINFVTIPGNAPIGDVSIEYLKQLSLLFLGLAVLFISPVKISKDGGYRFLLIVYFLLIMYYSSTLIWSISTYHSLRYINKVWLSFVLVATALTLDVSGARTLIKILPVIILSYALLSLISEYTIADILHYEKKDDPRFLGFSGIHSTKYLMSIGTLFFLVKYVFYRERRSLLGFILCGTIAILSLQRALIAALILSVSILFLLYMIKKRKIKVILYTITASFLIALSIFFLVFRYPPLTNRMFYSDQHAVVAEELLFNGRIFEIYGLIQMSGRNDFWLAAEMNDSRFFGNGFGTAGYLVERTIGQYWEMHNDYLKLSVETGYVGVFLYVLFISAFIITASLKAIKSDNKEIVYLYFISIAVFLITPLNGIFDNALDHIAKNITYALIIFICAIKIEANPDDA